MPNQPAVDRRRAVQLLGAASTVGAASALLGATTPTRATPAAGSPTSIVGTWYLTSPGPSTALIQIYHADGTHLSIHDQHAFRSPQPGVWEPVGEHEYLMRNLSFRFDEQGVRTGSIEIRAHYTVDSTGTTMRGRGLRLELDLAGELLEPPIPWTTEATRLGVVPLD
jgi:hypothetical protein